MNKAQDSYASFRKIIKSVFCNGSCFLAVVESDVGKRRENDEGGHGDYETPPRRKPM